MMLSFLIILHAALFLQLPAEISICFLLPFPTLSPPALFLVDWVNKFLRKKHLNAHPDFLSPFYIYIAIAPHQSNRTFNI